MVSFFSHHSVHSYSLVCMLGYEILVINNLQLNLRNGKPHFHELSLADFLGELLTRNLSVAHVGDGNLVTSCSL